MKNNYKFTQNLANIHVSNEGTIETKCNIVALTLTLLNLNIKYKALYTDEFTCYIQQST